MSDDSARPPRTHVDGSRRRLLAALAGAGALSASTALSGCLDGGSGAGTTSVGRTTSAAETTTSSAGATTTGDGGTGDTQTRTGGTAPGTTTGLDLREANVTAVGVSPVDSGTRFDVTLHHDDDGEDGYANWWVVETLDGEELGRRELAHPHCTCEFTRAATIQIPDGVECVVIRGHDQTHGYGGRAAIVTLSPVDVTFVDQGEERTDFSGTDCPVQDD